MEKKQTYIIATIVENKPGVLYEVSNLFRRRSFNIESISVGSTEQADLARMTITVSGEPNIIEQVVKQLSKLINVIKVSILNPTTSVIRELALIKISAFDSKIRSDIIQYANIFRGHILDVSSDSVTVEVTGDSEKIDAFIELTVPFGLKEIARTGITALARGGKAIKE
ncbi:MAG: acetolactate synthase small subunit [Candidatus Bathyarchaeota archaeon]|jgi:acetolactate synthase-1/3 small subunit|nr:MAG: acetolactate synthase small subunit [Candidatus Bathyarchaeota archaeon]